MAASVTHPASNSCLGSGPPPCGCRPAPSGCPNCSSAKATASAIQLLSSYNAVSSPRGVSPRLATCARHRSVAAGPLRTGQTPACLIGSQSWQLPLLLFRCEALPCPLPRWAPAPSVPQSLGLHIAAADKQGSSALPSAGAGAVQCKTCLLWWDAHFHVQHAASKKHEHGGNTGDLHLLHQRRQRCSAGPK
jgi:hypothetical protein